MTADDDLKYWRGVAFIARCARRYGLLYNSNETEPASSRAVVMDAVGLAEARVCIGGNVESNECLIVDGAYFDNYDIYALQRSLAACEDAANNTYADMSEDSVNEPEVRRIWNAIRLAQLAVAAAFPEGLKSPIDDLVDWAVALATDGEPALKTVVADDLARAKSNTQETSERVMEVFGVLWPVAKPDGWH